MKLPDDVDERVALALQEDIGSGDVTAALIEANAHAQATIITREDAVLCGTAWVNAAFKQVDERIQVSWQQQDAVAVKANSVLCTLAGPARGLLTAERVALNFLQTLSATATLTFRYTQRIAHTRCKILDTRKTLPGLRQAQKYAVLCGGGANHRIGLYDRVLIKENHIMAAGSIAAAVEQARKMHPNIPVEVETETLDEFGQASAAQADIIMLDEFNLDDMRTAVRLNAAKIPLEASGGVTLETVAGIAETGVDYISVGEITKHIRAVDLSMRFES